MEVEQLLKIPSMTLKRLREEGDAYIILPYQVKIARIELDGKRYKISRIGFLSIKQFEKAFLKETGYATLSDLLTEWKKMVNLAIVPQYVWVYRISLGGGRR